MSRKDKRSDDPSGSWQLFQAEAAYAEGIFRMSLGDLEASIAATKQALEIKPNYPPAVLTMGSIEYQRGREAEGKKLLLSLMSLPDDAGDLWEVIDKAGSFLIERRKYADGRKLYRRAVERFPRRAVLYQGLGCCAGHEGFFDEGVAASEKAVELEPENQEFTTDLGWSLFDAGRLMEARELLLRAVSMNPSDELARENLRICEQELAKGQRHDHDV